MSYNANNKSRTYGHLECTACVHRLSYNILSQSTHLTTLFKHIYFIYQVQKNNYNLAKYYFIDSYFLINHN